MKKNALPIAVAIVAIVLLGVAAYVVTQMQAKQEENEQMLEVLKMDKAEMEN